MTLLTSCIWQNHNVFKTKYDFKIILMSSNIRAPVHVLLNLLNSASLIFYFFSSTHLINSIKHEHSCKILYFSLKILKCFTSVLSYLLETDEKI